MNNAIPNQSFHIKSCGSDLSRVMPDKTTHAKPNNVRTLGLEQLSAFQHQYQWWTTWTNILMQAYTDGHCKWKKINKVQEQQPQGVMPLLVFVKLVSCMFWANSDSLDSWTSFIAYNV